MRFLLYLLLLFAFLFPARAGEQVFTNEVKSGVGSGLICDTPEQAERFVALRNDGTEAPSALRAINDEVSNPRACGIATVAFTGGETVAEKHLQGMLVTIVKITIIAVSDGGGAGEGTECLRHA